MIPFLPDQTRVGVGLGEAWVGPFDLCTIQGMAMAEKRGLEGEGDSLFLWCPGCDDVHRVTRLWTWEWENGGDIAELTIEPSILVKHGNTLSQCHSFFRSGQWQFLSDCSHELAGKTVPAVELPDWVCTGW
jgi:hypothetical protein